MSKKLIVSVVLFILFGVGGFYLYQNRPRPALETKFAPADSAGITATSQQDKQEADQSPESADKINLVESGDYALVENMQQVYQTFNNCGPATLSMILSFYGKNVSQKELGDVMRPYQNPQGYNDDKTIFTSEFVDWAKKYDLEAVGRVNGDIDLLKKFTANGIPVVVKTWLHPGEDIGHFRLVTGFDENKKAIIQSDSYEGPNRKFPYYDFLSMWQPFNYAYIIVYTPDLEDKVNAILGENQDETFVWQSALQRAEKEYNLDPQNPYPQFNLSTSYYHLGNYQQSVDAYERVENLLPRRMLWYQIEPILAYQKLGNDDRVFQIIDNILENGNKAFSELYQIKGEIYRSQGNLDKARQQFETALDYNKHYTPVRKALENL